MAFDISYVYKIVDKYTAPIKKIRVATDKVRKVVKATSLEISILQGKMYRLRNAAFKPFGGYHKSIAKIGAGFGNVSNRVTLLRGKLKKLGNELFTLRNVMLIGAGVAAASYPIKSS